MTVKIVQKRRSQARAAKKRAKSKSGARRPAVMTHETFRRIADPIVSEVAKNLDVPEADVAAVMEAMAEKGYLGLDVDGRLAARKPTSVR